ncbi:MAG: alpha/beta hydrolase [Lachnospiraceae bacterium]|jgi:pimeloyl-ACP methyl ester carboxylesterase|nr:alpha/beta hydrolase [Lachnospiraceae bacterium]
MKTKKTVLSTLAVLGASIAAIHVLNRVFQKISTSQKLLDDSEGDYFDWRFGRIYYKKSGSGSPLLLIHDLAPYCSSNNFLSVEGSLSNHHTVYSIDLLGCGRSARPDYLYTNYLYVQLITDFILTVIDKKTDVVVLGNSVPLVLAAKKNKPDLIGKIAIVNPPSPDDFRKKPSLINKLLSIKLKMPVIGTALFNLISPLRDDETFYEKNFSATLEGGEENKFYRTFEEAEQYNKPSRYLLSSILAGAFNVPVEKFIEGLDNSAHIFIGKDDPYFVYSSEQYKKINPKLFVTAFTKTKRYPQIEVPSTFIMQIQRFFLRVNL